MKKLIISLAAILALSSCGIYSKYKPVTEIPDGLYGHGGTDTPGLTSADPEIQRSDTAANFGNLSWREVFTDPYLRDTMMDFGVCTDTLECTVNWSNMAQVHRDVRKVCHALPNTIVTTHMSHCYPQGANLYFIFITKMSDADEFKAYHTTILDAIQKSGAAISHHHGIGKMFAPWLEGYIGRREYEVFRVLKNHFDPDYMMNPGEIGRAHV